MRRNWGRNVWCEKALFKGGTQLVPSLQKWQLAVASTFWFSWQACNYEIAPAIYSQISHRLSVTCCVCLLKVLLVFTTRELSNLVLGEAYRVIKTEIVPIIASMMAEYPMSMAKLFPGDPSADFMSNDLAKSDQFFDGINCK